MTDFKKNFDKVAKNIADKAANKDTPFAEVIDAFKAMTAYYALQLKHKDAPDEDTSGFDFANGIGAEQEHDDGRAVSRRRSS